MTIIQLVPVLILIFGLWAALSFSIYRLAQARAAISPAQEALRQAQDSVRRKNLFLLVLKRHRRNLRSALAGIEAELVAEKRKGALALQLFADAVTKKRWLSSGIDIHYRVRIVLDDTSLGPQAVIASTRVRRVDVAAVNKKLDNLAKPYLEAGLAVSVLKFSAETKIEK